MSKGLFNKMLAVLLIILLAGTNLLVIGTAVYAEDTGVSFDVYFEDNTKQKQANMEEGVNVLFKISVTSGYLKGGQINMTDSNFKMNVSSETKNEAIEKVDLDNNIIYLNQLNKGEIITLKIPVKINHSETFNLSNFEKTNAISLVGTLISGTSEGESTNINKTSNITLGWINEVEANLEQSLYRVVRTGEKTLIQLKVKSNIVNNNMPVQKESITMQAPTLGGHLPEDVTVFALTTEAANGDNGLAFVRGENYSYNGTTGIVSIDVENTATNNIINWNKNAVDEFYVTYIFNGDITETTFSQRTVLGIQIYTSGTNNIVTKELSTSIQIPTSDEDIRSGAITNLVETSNGQMSKAYLYTNNATNYDSIWEVGIDYKNIVDKIEVEQEKEEVVTKNEETLDITNKTKFTSTKVSKSNFDSILGTSGKIEVFDAAGTKVGQIDGSSIADSEGNYVINYSSDLSYSKTEKPSIHSHDNASGKTEGVRTGSL